MKILVVSSWFPYPPDNGAKLRVYNLLTRLSRRHSITLLSFAESMEEAGAAGLTGVCESVKTVPGNPFKPRHRLATSDLFSLMPRSYRQTYSPQMQALVDEVVPRCDAAVAFQLGAALYLRHHRSIPRIFEEAEVGSIRDQFRSLPVGLSKLRQGLTWWKYSRFLRSLVADFDRTTVVSDVERSHLIDFGCPATKVQVVPNGVDQAALLEPNRPTPGQLIYPGAVTYSANLEAVRYFVNDILPKVHIARPDAFLRVTGETGGVDLSGLTTPSVTFTGRVPDIKSEVTHSSVCVVPLKSGGGTRLKILEAMALGTPVVSTSKGAEGLHVKSGQHLLIADSPQAFAAHVIRLLDDQALRARIAANGRQLISRMYTWNEIGGQLDEVLNETVSARLQPRDLSSQATGEATVGAIAK